MGCIMDKETNKKIDEWREYFRGHTFFNYNNPKRQGKHHSAHHINIELLNGWLLSVHLPSKYGWYETDEQEQRFKELLIHISNHITTWGMLRVGEAINLRDEEEEMTVVRIVYMPKPLGSHGNDHQFNYIEVELDRP